MVNCWSLHHHHIPILIDGYELRPAFIAMVQEQSFSGQEEENPYTHLQEFEQLCSCLIFSGMTQETIKWKLFSFSFLGRAKQWYAHTVGGVHGNLDELQDKFVLLSPLFPKLPPFE